MEEEEEERQLLRTVISESLRSSWALWKVSGRQCGKRWRQPRGRTEEDFHTFETIRIQRGPGGLEGFEAPSGVWQGLGGLSSRLSAPHGADGEVTIGTPRRSAA